ncbi:hypothetical protein GCM10012289_76170 [Nonomuraea cavernae]|uniref:Uncharacterized protein n=2 Tax=Nonomuraea cavernae TaxID=2045107 RepID=A0A918DUP2_9ACTN|nr:hypothetical protein [Nonomuraea cavernae]GGO83203.1 hypothetical protein GCM10012289_76170 [Nonomuraea cavernae]
MIKAAAAVAAFGLAGAMVSTPAQAQERHLATESVGDGSAGGPGGLLRDLLGGLWAGKDAAVTGTSGTAAPGDTSGTYGTSSTYAARRPGRPLSSLETGSSEAGLPIGARLLGALPGVGGLGGLTGMAPGGTVEGRSPMSAVGAPSQGGRAALDEAGVPSADRLLGGTLYGAARRSAERARLAFGALSNEPSAELAPVVGRLLPPEMAPVVETLPGTARIATLDGSAPLFRSAAMARKLTGAQDESAISSVGAAVARTSAATGYAGRY